MTDPTLKANPFHGNPLTTRADVAKAALDVFNPLLPWFSAGGGRVSLSGSGAIFDRAAAELEGFARPLWGLAPLAAGGATFEHWALYRRGLVAGMDPNQPDYWGDVADRNQRLVELAAIGLALRLVPEHVFDPLSDAEKAIVSAYLLKARDRDYVDNNWKFFRVLVDLGLERCGIDFDHKGTSDYLDDLESFELKDGWYRDGPVRRTDHYIPFAMHFYGLIYARLQKGDEARAERLRARARRFAQDIRTGTGRTAQALPSAAARPTALPPPASGQHLPMPMSRRCHGARSRAIISGTCAGGRTSRLPIAMVCSPSAIPIRTSS